MARRSLSVNVMAHPARKDWAVGLAHDLGCPIVWERGRGVVDTRRRALEAHDGQFGLTVQDDAILCSGFQERALRFLEARDPLSTSFYTWKTPRPDERAQGWFRRPVLKGGVAVCLRADVISELLSAGLEGEHDDLAMNEVLHRLGIYTVYPFPSLVDHRDGPSLLNPGMPPRRAARFATPTVEA